MRQYVKKLYEESTYFAIFIAALAVALSILSFKGYLPELKQDDYYDIFYIGFNRYASPILGLFEGLNAFYNYWGYTKPRTLVVFLSSIVIATIIAGYALHIFLPICYIIPIFDLILVVILGYLGYRLIPRTILKHMPTDLREIDVDESNNNDNTKKWFSVYDALGFIIVSSIIWMICISLAWKTGSWVGGSHIPIPERAIQIAFLPSIIDAATGIVCLGFWIRSRSGTLITLFVTSLVMAGLQFLLSGWFLAMGSIT